MSPTKDSNELTRVLWQQLNIEVAEVEDLLVGLILDGKVKGRIDQIKGLVELDKLCVCVVDYVKERQTDFRSFVSQSELADRHKGLQSWSRVLASIQRSVVDKSAQRSSGMADEMMTDPLEMEWLGSNTGRAGRKGFAF